MSQNIIHHQTNTGSSPDNTRPTQDSLSVTVVTTVNDSLVTSLISPPGCILQLLVADYHRRFLDITLICLRGHSYLPTWPLTWQLVDSSVLVLLIDHNYVWTLISVKLIPSLCVPSFVNLSTWQVRNPAITFPRSQWLRHHQSNKHYGSPGNSLRITGRH